MKPGKALPRIYWGTKRDFVLLGIALTFWFVIAVSCLWLFTSFRVTSNFCEPTDEIYQFISANQDAWSSHFLASNLPSIQHFRDQLPNGDEITVIALEPSRTDNNLVFYIKTLFDFPATPEGSGGYLVTPSGVLPSGWEAIYRLKPMTDSIFCYSKSDQTSF
jgi:hypothetical protein